MRPRIGVLDLRVAVVLDPPHRWRAGRRARLKTGRRLVVQRDPRSSGRSSPSRGRLDRGACDLLDVA